MIVWRQKRILTTLQEIHETAADDGGRYALEPNDLEQDRGEELDDWEPTPGFVSQRTRKRQGVWTCARCTYDNEDESYLSCAMCGSPRTQHQGAGVHAMLSKEARREAESIRIGRASKSFNHREDSRQNNTLAKDGFADRGSVDDNDGDVVATVTTTNTTTEMPMTNM